MNRHKGNRSLTPTKIDRAFPHQVALADDLCIEGNYARIREFCEAAGLEMHTRHVLAIWPDRRFQQMRLHCFAEHAHAAMFQGRFGGEFFDPVRDREGGKTKGAWRRNGTWHRLLESGPLKVPKVLRD